jgi:broad specificity phosphatase PhoE
MHLYLIRHAQSPVNLENWEGGNLDAGLTELGQEQAKSLARWLPEHLPAIDALYCSTLRRARDTALFLTDVYPNQIHYDHRIREMGTVREDFTPWPNESMPSDYADYWSTERPFASIFPRQDGGETYMHFRTRVGMFLEELIQNHADHRVLAICHGGVIEATFDHIFNVGAYRHCEIANHNTGLTHVEHTGRVQREPWRLHYHNRIDHLL